LSLILLLALPATPSTLSLHDALPISRAGTLLLAAGPPAPHAARAARPREFEPRPLHAGDGRKGVSRRFQRGAAQPAQLRRHRASDRKSTRLNSSHLVISYAVFCLKKK